MVFTKGLHGFEHHTSCQISKSSTIPEFHEAGFRSKEKGDVAPEYRQRLQFYYDFIDCNIFI
jgi:hypothetical protein